MAQAKIDALKAQMQELKEIEAQLDKAPDKQVPLTDPDARSTKTHGTGIVGYNVQAAVDAKHHLIVAHDVTNIRLDRAFILHSSASTNSDRDTGAGGPCRPGIFQERGKSRLR